MGTLPTPPHRYLFGALVRDRSGEGILLAILDGEWSGEAALLTRAGREVPVSQVIIAPADADRRSEFLALIARDVKAMKQAEESLRESERFYRRLEAMARSSPVVERIPMKWR